MSTRLTSAVWERTDVDGTQKLLLLAIADHHNDVTGQCNPSVDTLSRRIVRSRGRTFELIRELEARGLLTHTRGIDDLAPGRGRSNRYELHLDRPPARTVRGTGLSAARTVRRTGPGPSHRSEPRPSGGSVSGVRGTGPESEGISNRNLQWNHPPREDLQRELTRRRDLAREIREAKLESHRRRFRHTFEKQYGHLYQKVGS